MAFFIILPLHYFVADFEMNLVPSTRLLWWVAFIVLPFGLLMALVPAAAPISLATIIALACLAGFDAVFGSNVLKEVGASLPEVLRLSKDRAAVLGLRLRKNPAKQLQLRLGLDWPSEIYAEKEELAVVLPAGAEWSQVNWPCRARRRGCYPLGRVYVESASRLGLWAVRKALPVASEIRVYPNLLSERKGMAALFLNRGTFGMHSQRQVGRGREFEKLRDYVHGDALDDVHWKASAKRGHPVTKVYQIERTQEVYVVVDASRLSGRRPEAEASGGQRSVAASEETGFPPASDTTLERFISAALVLCLAAEQQGDLFGLLTFSDRIKRFVRARNGKEHYNACRDALYTLEPRVASPDFDEVMSFIRVRLRRRALVVFLTALDDVVLAEHFVRSVELVSRQHFVLVNMLQPAGVRALFADANVAANQDLYVRLAAHIRWQNLRELEKVLQRRGVRFNLLANENLSAQLISHYLNIKRRQLL